MIAGIDFKIYQDFGEYITEAKSDSRYDWDYSKALEVLNEQLEKLVKRNKLTFLYNRRRIKPILPLKIWNCGNIFSTKHDEEVDVDMWEGVQIECEIDCEYKDFEWNKFSVGVCPDHFMPTGKFTK